MRLMTNSPVPPEQPAPSGEAVYTAFGERIDGPHDRYGYAGAWGYQSTLDDGTPPTEVFPFLHVGARYYDPTTGRFLQRDPIGIRGGTNVYVYALNTPTIAVDPNGEGFLSTFVAVVVVAVVVKAVVDFVRAYQYTKALSEQGPDRKKRKTQPVDYDDEIDDAERRARQLDSDRESRREAIEGIIRSTPNTSLRGRTRLPDTPERALLQLALNCATMM